MVIEDHSLALPQLEEQYHGIASWMVQSILNVASVPALLVHHNLFSLRVKRAYQVFLGYGKTDGSYEEVTIFCRTWIYKRKRIGLDRHYDNRREWVFFR